MIIYFQIKILLDIMYVINVDVKLVSMLDYWMQILLVRGVLLELVRGDLILDFDLSYKKRSYFIGFIYVVICILIYKINQKSFVFSLRPLSNTHRT